MSEQINALLVGESWVSTSTHIKGWDFFSSSVYETGAGYLKAAVADTEIRLSHLEGHRTPEEFPLEMAGLEQHDVLILSDIGANSLLLHPDTWLRGRTVPNRLRLIADWVESGGGLAMCGGYMSFAGIYGSARYAGTPVEKVLPVSIFQHDDRIEAPQGADITLKDADHPTIRRCSGEKWPPLLGFNQVEVKPSAQLVATADGHPLLATSTFGKGRTLAWTSDIGPHWCPVSFAESTVFRNLWQDSIRWLAGRL